VRNQECIKRHQGDAIQNPMYTRANYKNIMPLKLLA